jgi:hypothetical protein
VSEAPGSGEAALEHSRPALKQRSDSADKFPLKQRSDSAHKIPLDQRSGGGRQESIDDRSSQHRAILEHGHGYPTEMYHVVAERLTFSNAGLNL